MRALLRLVRPSKKMEWSFYTFVYVRFFASKMKRGFDGYRLISYTGFVFKSNERPKHLARVVVCHVSFLDSLKKDGLVLDRKIRKIS